MDTTSRMVELISRLNEVMNARRDRLESFCLNGVQVEGWLKGELLYFLDTEKAAGRLSNFKREATIHGRRKVDIWLAFDHSIPAWVELKLWLIGKQGDYLYDARFYFADSTSNGIKRDVEKLMITNEDEYVLVLATANPTVDKWSEGVARFNEKFAPFQVSSLTDPGDYPSDHFLGLLAVR